jgi:hypothetical protein
MPELIVLLTRRGLVLGGAPGFLCLAEPARQPRLVPVGAK